MAGIQEYKCPCCGGTIAFDSTIQKVKCPFCDTEYEMETLASYDSELQNEQADDMTWETAAGGAWERGEASGLSVYVCNSCGSEIVSDKNTATSCPYCGNAVVVTRQFSGALKPDYIIPFQKDKKAAVAALKKYYAGKCLLPKVFKDENHMNEVKGVYVPFWVFDAVANANMRYRATKVRTWSDSRYEYTETSHFLVSRDGNIRFEDVPVDGSTKIPDHLMELIEPFDFSKAVDFQTAYLAGYLADQYDVDTDQSVKCANEQIRKSTETAFDATAKGYATVTKETGSIQLSDSKVRYTLLPVWLLHTKWNGENYLFAMNGQTGKMVGNLPLDKAAYKKHLFGLTGVIGFALFAASYLIWLL
ncbi:MAG: hypothetical protein K2N89_10265 [Lachnospiraceae bacterium]|nr:hypothetical protein [Lachnospiraceae bacterium]